MNVLYIRTDICGNQINVGGSVGHTLGVIRSLVHKKYNLYVASSQTKKLLAQEKSIQFFPLRVYRCFAILTFERKRYFWRMYYLRWRLECLFSNLFFPLQILWHWRGKKFSFIYQRYSILNFCGVILAKIKGIFLILEYNGSEVWLFHPAKTAPWYERWFGWRRLSQWVENYNLKHADIIVVVSRVLQDDLISRGVSKHKILINPNGVDKEHFMPAQKNIQNENFFTIGFIGTFSFWHGINILQAIIPPLVKKYTNIRFLLIGDGALRASLENYLTKEEAMGSVIFTGIVPQHEASIYLDRCDAYLCPTQPNTDGSRFFGSPTKLFEYMAMGRPIIASDIEQVGEIISPCIKITKDTNLSDVKVQNQLGILVDPLDEQGFIRAIELCLFLSEQDQQKLGDNARNAVLEKYTWNKHVERILDFFESASESRK